MMLAIVYNSYFWIMKYETITYSSKLSQSVRSLYFTLFLSLGMIATACNPGTAQNDKAEAAEADKAETTEAVRAEYQNIDVTRFDELRKNKDYVVLDVRTPKEVAAGKVAEAVVIDYFGSSFESELGKLDKSKQWLVYCKVGGRSSKAAQQMIDMGFEKVYNLDGGYTSWSAAHPADN
jgi:rhodanese-related sulfurtransferase